ncbi:ABC transporter permease [Fulvivirgaceae bacterium BMA10]|uniref:ABC transporter permease n=1 Tax=Splendidivirga corallicola TaxID=3051826 RepID=A0ABT8KNN0_9BACT|nr:ABC transporter permease [Fulvivirgaceae bacterium BMA10]
MRIFLILSNYFKTSIRNIAKNKTFTFINVLGLAISISVGLVMITFISEINEYDNFHTKSDRTYRVLNTYQYMEEDPSYFASTSALAGRKIEESVPGIEALTLIRRNFGGDFGFDDHWIPLSGMWATEPFFDIFSFQMLKGNPATALKEPNTMVLTESAARKIFGDKDPLGKSILRNKDEEFTITGIVADPPKNSSLHFETIGSFATLDEKEKDNVRWMKWSNMWMFHVYLLLEENQTVEDVQAAFDQISAEENAKNEYTKITISLQALDNIIPGRNLSNEIGKSMDSDLLWMITALSFVVIISACFNYTNLSIARALRRSKEVGIRKVMGASRGQVFVQFILEAVIIALLSLMLAIGLFHFIKPGFLSLDTFVQDLVAMNITGNIAVKFVLLAVITGMMAGFFPAIFFSRLNPQAVLKDNSIKLFKNIGIRKLLIIFQFTLSLMFIVAATIQYNQYRYSLSFDLGYNTENILNLRLQGNEMEIVENELRQLPEVTTLSSSLMITSVGSYYGENLKYKDPQDSASCYFNTVDENYLPLHGHKFLAGGNFTQRADDSLKVQVIVNQKVLERFDMPKGEKAIGEILEFGDREAEVVGVLKDFHYGTLESDIKPFLFSYGKEEADYLNIKLVSGDMLATMDKIESIWKKIDPIHPIRATFYDDRIQDTYSELVVMVRIIGFLAFLAITIAVMGLLGMVMFTTETRLKEISIRKVLGASEGKLIVLIGRGFVWLLFISALVAIPATYYLFDTYVFDGITYRAPIGIMELFSGTALVFMIALLAVGTQTIMAARTNPATTLRNE